MPDTTYQTDSIPVQGFQLGYLHKQAAAADEISLDAIEAAETAASRPPEPHAPPAPPAPRLFTSLGAPNPFDDDEETDDPWDPQKKLELEQQVKEIDQSKNGLQMAKYAPASVPVPSTSGPSTSGPSNRDKIRQIVGELGGGAAIGGTAGVGLSLAHDATKGEGINVGKAVGLGAAGAATGALIQALAKRQKLRGIATA